MSFESLMEATSSNSQARNPSDIKQVLQIAPVPGRSGKLASFDMICESADEMSAPSLSERLMLEYGVPTMSIIDSMSLAAALGFSEIDVLEFDR